MADRPNSSINVTNNSIIIIILILFQNLEVHSQNQALVVGYLVFLFVHKHIKLSNVINPINIYIYISIFI